MADLNNMAESDALRVASDTWSSLGEDNALSVITALDNINGKYNEVSGTMQQVMEQRYASVNATLQTAGRKIITDISDPIKQQVMPKIEELASGFLKNSTVAKDFGNTVAKVTVTLLDNTDTIIAGVKGIGTAFVTLKAAQAIGKINSSLGLLQNGAINVQGALNKMLGAISGNPAMVAAAAVGLITAAVSKERAEVEDAKNAILDQCATGEDGFNGLKDKIEQTAGAVQEIQDNLNSASAEADTARDTADELINLADKTDRTAEETDRLKNLVGQLNTIMPDLNLQYDNETSKLNLSTQAIRDKTNAYADMVEQQALYNQQVKIKQELYEAEYEEKHAKDAMDMADAAYQSAKDRNSIGGGATGSVIELYKEEKAAKQAAEEADSAWIKARDNVEALKAQQAELEAISKKLTTATQDNTKATKDNAGATKTATTATEEKKKTDSKWLSEAKSFLDKKETYNDLSNQDEADYWDAIRKKMDESTDERVEADKNYYTALKAAEKDREELQQEEIEATEKARADLLNAYKTNLSNIKVYRDVSAKEEANYWAGVRKQFAQGTDERIEADKAYLDALKSATEEEAQARADKLNAYKDYLDKESVYRDISLAEETEYWKQIRKQFKKGTDERLEADKTYYSKKQELNSKLKSLEADYKKSVSQTYTDLKKEVQSLTEAYEQSVQTRADAITNSMDLFSKFEESENVSGTQLISNLEGQVDALEDWQNNLQKLRDRGADKGLVSALEQAGVQKSAEVAAIANMTDEELTKYNDLYRQKNETAKNEALKELEDLKTQTGQKIQALTKTANNKLETYKKTLVKDMSALGVEIKKPIGQIAVDMEDAGDAIVTNISKGMQKPGGKAALKVATKDIAKSVKKELSDATKGSGATIGKSISNGIKTNVGAGIGTGIVNGIKSSTKSATSAAADLGKKLGKEFKKQFEKASKSDKKQKLSTKDMQSNFTLMDASSVFGGNNPYMLVLTDNAYNVLATGTQKNITNTQNQNALIAKRGGAVG